jgi:hypothetical protein
VKKTERDRIRAQIAALEKRLQESEPTEDHLSVTSPSRNVSTMTPEQIARRGRAVSAAVAAKSKDPLLKAIAASQWRTQANYALRRLKITSQALSQYRTGVRSTPRYVAIAVEKDFGIPPTYWKAVVD